MNEGGDRLTPPLDTFRGKVWWDMVGYTRNPMWFICPLYCDTSFNRESWFQQHIEKNKWNKNTIKKFAKKPPDMKNHQNKCNKKQTNANVEFPKFFCFCAHFFHCFCDFGFLGCFLLFALVLFFSKILYSLCWSSQNHCIQKTQKQSHHNNICYKRKQRAENVWMMGVTGPPLVRIPFLVRYD